MQIVENIQIGIFSDQPLKSAHDVATATFDRPISAFNAVNPAASLASIALPEFVLHTQVTPGRADFVVAPPQQQPPVDGVGIDFDFGLKQLLEPVKEFCTSINVSRLAVIVNGFDKASTLLETVELGVDQAFEGMIPSNCLEFEIKMNIPSKSKIQNALTINRLYQLKSVSFVSMILASDGTGSVSPIRGGQTEWRLVHQIDTNTAPDVRLDQQHVSNLLDELCETAKFLKNLSFKGLQSSE
jgi:hypothetical protein